MYPIYQEEVKAKECFFHVEREKQDVGIGMCTSYGACRYQGQDYMYQVRFYEGVDNIMGFLYGLYMVWSYEYEGRGLFWI